MSSPAIIAAIAFYPITSAMMDDLTRIGGRAAPGVGDLYLCALIGLVITALLFVITDYYTSTRFGPVKKTARRRSRATRRTSSRASRRACRRPRCPALVIVLGIFSRNELAGIYGVGVAGDGAALADRPDRRARRVRPDHRQRRRHRRDGRHAEEVRNVTDPLDAVGNTTKAVTKGYAIGSAALAALVLFAAFKIELQDEVGSPSTFALDDPDVLIGLIIGGMMVTLFAALSMEAVGRAGGAVVEEVRRQFREKPGIMEGTDKPDYAQCVDIVTKAAQREMILPSLIPIFVTLIVGLLSVKALGGLLIGVIVVGLFFAILMTAGGGAWDNAKKLIEDGAFGGKGSEAHAASVTGDTVGDPFKDTAGPAINPMIKVANIVALLIIPLIA
jgi:K(+)-stimulated pyrophosphate-energized sodium pump